MLGSTPATCKCPQCGTSMRTFECRLYDLELDFCEDQHGFWLEPRRQRVLELMKKEEKNLGRKVLAEDRLRRIFGTQAIDHSYPTPQPAYPDSAQLSGEQGDVLVGVHVNASGKPRRLRIDKSSGFGDLDDAAAAAVAQWRFTPAVENGDTPSAWTTVKIHFELPLPAQPVYATPTPQNTRHCANHPRWLATQRVLKAPAYNWDHSRMYVTGEVYAASPSALAITTT